MVLAIKTAYGQDACLGVTRVCWLLSQHFHRSIHFRSIPEAGNCNYPIFRIWEEYGNFSQYWAAHDPEVAIGESLAREVSTLEERNHDVILIKVGFASHE